METKRAKVIILPTEIHDTSVTIDSGIILHSTGLDPYHHYDSERFRAVHVIGGVPQHLYIAVDGSIEDGNWKLNTEKKVVQHKKGDFLPHYGNKHLKIIATTDKSLTVFNTITDETLYLPQPSQAFIEKYCKVGGIDEVLVEYESRVLMKPADVYNETVSTIPKVDSHNTITIHPIKDSWSREEVETFKSLASSIIIPAIDILPKEYDQDVEAYLNWIEENL